MKRVCVIGAGPSGLAAARNAIQAGLGDGLVVFEKSGEVGGNWVFREGAGHSSVYESTHIISSKYHSAYEDFPFPEGTADYPSHKELRRYFESYATHFGVHGKIRFRTEVLSAIPEGDQWRITSKGPRGKKTETFDALMVANGHHWDPSMPALPGKFSGRFMHSHDFKHARPFAGKRVLVMGGGNSAADVAVECSRVAAHTTISMRHGHWFLPKFVFGVPNDVLYHRSLWLPGFIRQPLLRWTILLLQGSNSRYGLPEPSYDILEGHPTLNSELYYFIRHGEISPKPGIKSVKGSRVTFADDSSADFDVIIAATGYNIVFPFLDKSIVDLSGKTEVGLWRKMFHPHYHNLYFIGLFQPLGCIWPLADFQAKLACQEILGKYERPSNIGKAIDKEIKKPHYKFVRSPRHSTEVDYPRFRRELLTEIRKCRP
ncbi:MAG TPA: NAD(P)-binding domain-containing protein [Leptospiraceae bacterium]|nr:NAD(P)-binding domain-containing protein [Leptospiraceae bacterium]HNN73650.1 NAD(P)-binding domain-containing protein [Leptospiraceae bacterium]